MTVEDRRLSLLYKNMASDGGEKIKSTDGEGVLSDDLGLFQAECPTGDVSFLIRVGSRRHSDLVRQLFPRYVSEEANRIGCGPLHITLPD